MKCGCEASFRIKRVADSNRWNVDSIKDQHNHPIVTPSKHQYLRTNRVIPTRSKELFKALKSSNLAPSKQFEIAATEFGGYECISFSQSDFNNMRRDDYSLVSQNDVDIVVEHFKEHRRFNNTFYYNLLRDQSSMYFSLLTKKFYLYKLVCQYIIIAIVGALLNMF